MGFAAAISGGGIITPLYQGRNEGVYTTDGSYTFDNADFSWPTINFPAGLRNAKLFLSASAVLERCEDQYSQLQMNFDGVHSIGGGGSSAPTQVVGYHNFGLFCLGKPDGFGNPNYVPLLGHVLGPYSGGAGSYLYGYLPSSCNWVQDLAFSLSFEIGMPYGADSNTAYDFTWNIEVGYVTPRS